MIHALSNHLVSLLKERQQLNEDEFDLYVFGAEVFFITLIKWGGLLAIGLVFGMLIESFVFILAFTCLRNQAGGIHSQSLIKCFIATAIMMVLSIYISGMIPGESAFLIQSLLLTISVLLVFLYAPVDTPNKPLDAEERVHYRKKSRKTVLFGTIFILGGSILNKGVVPYSTIAAISFLIEAVTLAPFVARK